ncbi:alcohol dehydrogenase catalytic domain-containing protein [Paenibacillus taihuensis]|uniref:alcohol dehydrogenase catalytic domain-containing protein n=1 Tax=Paenibacillus taihuensis TaxID=1156355 RepID=UPI000E220A02
MLIYCGSCPRCVRGQTNLCDRRQIIGIHRPGAYAERIAAPASQVTRIPDSLSYKRRLNGAACLFAARCAKSDGDRAARQRRGHRRWRNRLAVRFHRAPARREPCLLAG